ncbi:33661_t:CDS:1, partial [Gigaspora margarita]
MTKSHLEKKRVNEYEKKEQHEDLNKLTLTSTMTRLHTYKKE